MQEKAMAQFKEYSATLGFTIDEETNSFVEIEDE